jgi:hypothetical protein
VPTPTSVLPVPQATEIPTETPIGDSTRRPRIRPEAEYPLELSNAAYAYLRAIWGTSDIEIKHVKAQELLCAFASDMMEKFGKFTTKVNKPKKTKEGRRFRPE